MALSIFIVMVIPFSLIAQFNIGGDYRELIWNVIFYIALLLFGVLYCFIIQAKIAEKLFVFFVVMSYGFFVTSTVTFLHRTFRFPSDYFMYPPFALALTLIINLVLAKPFLMLMERIRTMINADLESQFSRRNVHTDIFEYENGETFLTSAKECPFTVAFLDIYMNGSNGIDTAKELRRSDTDCLLIFTTTSTDHALEGFQVRALHYLVKPYSENDISVLADEILSRIPDSGKYIDVKVNGSNIQIPFRKIIYAEHFSHMIHIHTAGERELVTRQSFDSFITSLKMDSRFYRCNRGVVINLEHAVDFDGSGFRLDNGSNVPVSRKLLKNARQTFMEFLFQRRS